MDFVFFPTYKNKNIGCAVFGCVFMSAVTAACPVLFCAIKRNAQSVNYAHWITLAWAECAVALGVMHSKAHVSAHCVNGS